MLVLLASYENTFIFHVPKHFNIYIFLNAALNANVIRGVS